MDKRRYPRAKKQHQRRPVHDSIRRAGTGNEAPSISLSRKDCAVICHAVTFRVRSFSQWRPSLLCRYAKRAVRSYSGRLQRDPLASRLPTLRYVSILPESRGLDCDSRGTRPEHGATCLKRRARSRTLVEGRRAFSREWGPPRRTWKRERCGQVYAPGCALASSVSPALPSSSG